MRLTRPADLCLYIPFTLLRVTVFAYAGWVLFRTPAESSWLALDALAILLLLPAGFDQLAWLATFLARRPDPCPPPPREARVAAVTTYVAGVEPLEMLERTLAALTAMEVPHDSWLLDESDSAEVLALCARLGVRHFTRRWEARYNTVGGTFEAGSKHGNYNAWLEEHGYAGYDVVAAFDPDHVPAPSFLAETLGCFSDPGVGYVQAAQAYYNQQASFIARGAAEETYAYYSIVQMATARFGYPVITGCHNLHRVEALREAGGFADHPADDLLLTLRYQAKGWRGVYVPRILARGLAPVDWAGYVGQQFRWARSLIDLKLRRPGAARRSGPGARILSLLQGVRYLLDGAFVIAVLLLTFLALATGNAARFLGPLGVAALLYGVLAITNLYKQRFFLDPAGESGLHWRSWLLRFVKWPWTFRAAVSALRNLPYRYVITPKVHSRRSRRTLLGPMLSLSAVPLAGWVVGRISGAGGFWPLDAFAAVLVLLPLAVASTERLRYPAPYNPRLRPDLSPPPPAAPAATQLTLAAVAVVAVLWSLGGAFAGTPAGTDSARHAMNGVFLMDLVRSGGLAHPVSFARWYFNHLPAISLPYHPPVFPAWEAIWYAVFGVQYWAARLALAAAVGLSAALFFSLLRDISASIAVAALGVLALLSLPVAQWVARDVMLEFPALVFVLLGITVWRRWRDRLTLRRGIAYGLIAAAGIWTKQTIFLPLIPFLDLAFARDWKSFRRPGLWVSAAIGAGATALLLALVSVAGGEAIPRHWAPLSLAESLSHNLHAYARTGGPLLATTLALLAATALAPGPRLPGRWLTPDERLLLAWFVSVAVVVLPVPAYDERYAFYAMPPLVAAAYALGLRLLRIRVSPRAALAILSVATVAILAAHGMSHEPYFTGPDTAARQVVRRGIRRVLYLGRANGSFAFSLRSAVHDPMPAVFRGDKLGYGADSRRLQEFARRYGVDAVFVEPAAAPEWKKLVQNPPPAFEFRRRFTLHCFDPNLAGDLIEYRVANPSATPESAFQQSISSFGSTSEAPL